MHFFRALLHRLFPQKETVTRRFHNGFWRYEYDGHSMLSNLEMSDEQVINAILMVRSVN